MAHATDRQSFIIKCLHRLGWPVQDIELDDDQIDDLVDYSLSYYADYHFDATEKIYYKVALVQNNFPNSIHNLTVANSGGGYQNTDTVVFHNDANTMNPDFIIGNGSGANAHIVTDANGAIVEAVLDACGNSYAVFPRIEITSNTGSGGAISGEMGGWIPMPENVIGAVKIFDLSSALSSSNLFNIQYQFVLNELYTFSSTYSMIPYYMTLQYISLIQQLLVGLQPIRFNRHRHRLFIDMNWDRIALGQYVVVEAYEVVDPDVFTAVWDDRWLYRYCTAQIKLNWGTVLKKFTGVKMIGDTELNGQQIYNEAYQEIQELEHEMINTYSIPSAFDIG